MKKLLLGLMVLAIVVPMAMVVTACGGNEDNNNNGGGHQTSNRTFTVDSIYAAINNSAGLTVDVRTNNPQETVDAMGLLSVLVVSGTHDMILNVYQTPAQANEAAPAVVAGIQAFGNVHIVANDAAGRNYVIAILQSIS